jgi:L-threonate 2-dehydrogenase
MKIALVAPGEIGAGLCARLVRRGATVVTSLAGRSSASAARAAAAGMQVAAGDDDLIDADLVLSVLPPSEAADLARRLAPALARAGGQPAYADCNAVAPETARQIADVIAPTGAAFIDIGIVGGPPREDDAGPRLYACGPGAPRVLALRDFGLDVRVLPGPVGEASALKMAYASITKGFTALGENLKSFRLDEQTGAALDAEFASSQPELSAWLNRQVPSMPPKAYRWVGEMEEIARCLDPAPGGDIYRAIAQLYDAVAKQHAR